MVDLSNTPPDADAPVDQATVDKRVNQYIQIRAKIKEVKDRHEKELADLQQVQTWLSAWMQSFMERADAKSIKTKHGTCYLSTRYSAALNDPKAFMDYVIANQDFDLLDRRANVTAVKAFVEKNNHEPPGCSLSGITTVGVRRPTGKTDAEPKENA